MNVALLTKLIEAGTPAELVAEVAAELGRAESDRKSLEQRRAHERERKAKSREVTGQDVTDVTFGDGVSLDKERSPRPPKEINPIPCVQGARAKWHRLPEEWQPRSLPIPVQGKVDQWPPGTLADELAAFRRWAVNAEDKNGKGRKLDWDQAWRNWIARRHDERHSRTNSMGRNQPADGLSSTARAGLAVFGSSHPG